MSHNELLQKYLGDIASKDVPSVDLRQRVEARVNPEYATRSKLRLSPLVLIGLVLLAVFAITATVYATGSGFRQLFQMDPRLQRVDPSQMGSQLNLSQTQNGVTVQLLWAYADQNRVLVGYSLNAEGGKRFDPQDLKLVDVSGVEYPFDFGYGVNGHSELLKVDLPAGQSSYIDAFVLPNGKQTGQNLTLTLQLEASELVLPTSSASQPTQAEVNNPASVMLEPLPVGQLVGPFEFHFTIRINP